MTIDPSKLLIGFIGQGFVGKAYANNFEARGYDTVRYSIEPEHEANRPKIKNCDIVFVAVPTPTTPDGFSASTVDTVLNLVGPGKIAVIKSTVLPGTTERLQAHHPDIMVLFSPEFLSAGSAQGDTDKPFSNIVGLSRDVHSQREAAAWVHRVLPYAPFCLTMKSTEAELLKYAHNVSATMQVLTFNLLYEIAQGAGADWSVVRKAIDADPFMANQYADPVHAGGRGAGGACFIKDFAAFGELYRKLHADRWGAGLLMAAEEYNLSLLTMTQKDQALVEGVYGKVDPEKYLERRQLQV